MRSYSAAGCVLALMFCASAHAQDAARDEWNAWFEPRNREALAKVDPDLPEYVPSHKLRGAIRSKGEDALNNMLTLFAEIFNQHHPEVTVEIEGRGSSTAPPALYNGYWNLGTMTRPYNDDELKPFVEKFGYPPTQLIVTHRVPAVWVHKDNPIASLSLVQLDAIFSAERRRGGDAITTWGQLGLAGEWVNRPIAFHCRSSTSGFFRHFKHSVLKGSGVKDGYVEHRGSRDLITAIAADPAAIGLTDMGDGVDGVRAVPLVNDNDDKAVSPSLEAALDGRYPLTQPMILVVNHKPGTTLDPVLAEFLTLVFSKQGQAIVVLDGYPPLPAAFAREQLMQVDLAKQ